jgi:hypothetical protein
MFFLPPALLGVLTAGLVGSGLDEALEGFRKGIEEPVKGKRAGSAAVVVGLWAAAWTGFGAAWAVFLTMVEALGRGSRGIAFGVVLVLVTAVPVVVALLPVRRDPVIRLLTRRAALLALVPAGLGAVIWLKQQPSVELNTLPFGVAWLYLGTLALALTAGALRLGSPRVKAGTVIGAGAAYILAGLLLLLSQFFPLGSGYNSVGVLFPVWGISAPAAVAVWGLRRWSATARPATASPGEGGGPGAGEFTRYTGKSSGPEA